MMKAGALAIVLLLGAAVATVPIYEDSEDVSSYARDFLARKADDRTTVRMGDDDTCEDEVDEFWCLKYKSWGWCKHGNVVKSCEKTCKACLPAGASPTPTMIPSLPPGISPTPACRGTDLCIVADVFTSLGEKGWEKDTKFFLKKIIRTIRKVFPHEAIRFSGVVFGTAVYDSIDWTENGNEVVRFFREFDYVEGGSRIDKALRQCEFEDSAADKILMLVTDGNSINKDGSPQSFSLVKKQADQLKADGVTVLTIGIADDGNFDKLVKLSGKMDSDTVLYHPIEKYATDKAFSSYASKIIVC